MANRNISHALNFHEITKHSYVSVRTDRYYLDWSIKPYPFKVYVDLPKIPLPKDFPKPEKNALECFKQPEILSEEDLDLKKITELLYFTAGISRVKKFGLETYYFRVAPATGALYSTEVYFMCKDLKDLKAGLYHFDPGEFVITKLREGDYRYTISKFCGNDINIAYSPVTFIFTSIGWRNVWKYRIRSYRHWFWDSGVMIANLLSVANSENLETKLIMNFVDKEINRFLGIDGKKECTLALVSIGAPKFKNEEERTIEDIKYQILPLSKKEIEYKEIYEMHENSSLYTIDEVIELRNEGKAGFYKEIHDKCDFKLLGEEKTETPLWKVILKRGSTRRFSLKPIKASHLYTILKLSTTGINCDFLKDYNDTLIEIYLIVNAIEGLETGAYYYNKKLNCLELLKKGKFRETAGYLCLEQDLGYEASVVFFLMNNLNETLKKFGNRGYRMAQIEAGIIAGKIYLTSYSLNIGATGLTFYDDDITNFFSPHASNKSNMMVVAIGYPAYKAKEGKIYTGIVKHKIK
jgi:SagB-type dehydrogenase family enzyme